MNNFSPLLLSAALLTGTGNTTANTTSAITRESCGAVNGSLEKNGTCSYRGLNGDKVTVTAIDFGTCVLAVSDKSRVVSRNCNEILKDIGVK